MTEADFRNALRGVLAQFNDSVDAAIRRELANPIDLEPNEHFWFEAYCDTYGILGGDSRDDVLDDMAVLRAIPEAVALAAEEADVDLHELLGVELFPWLADRWQAVGGPMVYSPAFAQYHDVLGLYHLEQYRWCPVEEVWPPAE